MKIFVILECLIVLSHIGIAQNQQAGFINYVDNGRLYQGVSGHPYLFPRWETGELVWNDKLLKDVAFKFDIHADQIMFMRFTDNDSIMLDSRRVDRFTFYSQNNREFVKYNFNQKPYFFEVVHKGKISFLKRWRKVFVQADQDITYTSNNFKDEYRLRSQLFIEKNGVLQRLKSKKSLLKMLSGADKTEINHYIKRNQLFLKDESDILKVLTYYDRL